MADNRPPHKPSFSELVKAWRVPPSPSFGDSRHFVPPSPGPVDTRHAAPPSPGFGDTRHSVPPISPGSGDTRHSVSNTRHSVPPISPSSGDTGHSVPPISPGGSGDARPPSVPPSLASSSRLSFSPSPSPNATLSVLSNTCFFTFGSFDPHLIISSPSPSTISHLSSPSSSFSDQQVLNNTDLSPLHGCNVRVPSSSAAPSSSSEVVRLWEPLIFIKIYKETNRVRDIELLEHVYVEKLTVAHFPTAAI